ncbi:hypothetical protein Tco_0455910 [Tanacetum coccineum]
MWLAFLNKISTYVVKQEMLYMSIDWAAFYAFVADVSTTLLPTFICRTSRGVFEFAVSCGPWSLHRVPEDSCVTLRLLNSSCYDFTTKYIGGLHILIQIPDQESVDKALPNASLALHFKALIPWNITYRIPNRITWLTISDLPP